MERLLVSVDLREVKIFSIFESGQERVHAALGSDGEFALR